MTVSKRRIAHILVGVALVGPLTYIVVLFLRAHRITLSVVDKAQMIERTGLGITDLPGEWKDILLKVEDPGFYRHNGVDLSTPGSGLTTITQALVKAHYFESFTPGLHAKLKQTLFAMVLDREMEKDLQLTLFLNTASLGPSGDEWLVGFPEAAHAYFGKPLLELARVEFITLVTMLIGPATYHPTRNPDALADRVSRIERLLLGDCEPAGLRDVYYEACSQ